MTVALSRIVIPARSKWASATFLASILNVPAGPQHQRPGEVSHLPGGRGVWFDDPDGHTIEITSQPHGDRPA